MDNREEFRRKTDVSIAEMKIQQQHNADSLESVHTKLDSIVDAVYHLPCGERGGRISMIQWILGLLIVVGVPAVCSAFYVVFNRI